MTDLKFSDFNIDSGAYAVCLCPRSCALDPGPIDENSLNSGSPGFLAHNKWDLCVRVLCCIDLPLLCTSIPTSSWEYVTTLDFELDIIRGRRSYQWTIWVCSGRRFFACRYLSFEIRAESVLDLLACALGPSYRHNS